jgi:SAM-dependent methyltransferase
MQQIQQDTDVLNVIPRLDQSGCDIPHQGDGEMDIRPEFNYVYFIGHAAIVGGRILDYGCGRGQVVELGLQRGLDVWGADTFTGYWGCWEQELTPRVRERVKLIQDGKTDFPESHFDFVMANQVLEHVTDPEAVITDIHRMLKPGGLFIAAFPVTETWYEGHIGLYFAHRFKPKSRARRMYFDLCHRLGCGLYRGNLSRPDWIKQSEHSLDASCFYSPRRRMFRALTKAFGMPLEDIAAHYMRVRLKSRAFNIPAFADPLLRFVYHKRAGEIVAVRKPK